MIKPEDLIQKFRYALDNDWGYIWKTAGKLWTEKDQAAATREQTVAYGEKWIGHYVADCSGLFSWAFKQLGGYVYHGSNTMYDKYCTCKGVLRNGKKGGTEAILPGTAVFTGDDSNKGHVGLYCGNNEVIEAAGTQQGVIKSKLTDKKWKYWGELKGVDYGLDDETTEDIEAHPLLKKGDSGMAVSDLQSKLIERGFPCGSTGVDGKFGNTTLNAVKQFQQYSGLKVDGIVGPKTWAALEMQTSAGKTYTVTISGVNKEQATALLRQFPEADVKENA